MLKDLFKKTQYITVSKVSFDDEIIEEGPNIPSGMWSKCHDCGNIVYTEDLDSNLDVCNKCGFHLRINANERIKQVFDKESFNILFSEVITKNHLGFKGYEEKLRKGKEASGSDEAVICGVGKINGINIAAAVMDSFFMMGSMGSAVGEKITRTVEYATLNKLPLVIFTTSGGARMQEGIFSLMQMAKISGAIGRHDEEGLLYITVLTNPTTGGVTASFAMQGDIIISEPRATIGFAGRRVIENTIKETLPETFQKAEFLLEKGFIDAIVHRRELKGYIYKILNLHGVNKNE
ncbi:acetyl-CoA carboxylase, carboxyltransferase subunit beta [Clostridium gasigenes]|uniref:acetyl-CoA carboxylase, carboxyltransferase subunit beta n=1 Tax=Clostridium gasigenes TaxID=94869 RepID=UPI001C0D257A|nr:acetyl-CoA carboxylase, carboxyltransferase subunit beta [Clostridium gasigenes]MBU3132542.1 acetyl-CoA carboxylase, carboxyltransferase subunit beta [Clostridium gasigenes]